MDDQQIFDGEVLLQRAMGEVDLVEQILALFRDDSANQLTHLERFAAEGPTRELVRAAHQLKGSSLNAGANALAGVAARLERAAGEEPARVPELMREVAARHAELLRVLDERA